MPSTANEETDDEKERLKCVSIGSGPAGRWLVVLEHDNNFDVESTHDARDDAPQASERSGGRVQGAFG